MKNKITAALLAFFFGWIGVHKFYLGQNFAGIIYILFCWTFIPGFIAFFEFLGLLLMPDDRFNAQFNPSFAARSIGSPRSAKDITSAIADLKQLYEAGAVTAQEYEEKRQKLLKDL